MIKGKNLNPKTVLKDSLEEFVKQRERQLLEDDSEFRELEKSIEENPDSKVTVKQIREMFDGEEL